LEYALGAALLLVVVALVVRDRLRDADCTRSLLAGKSVRDLRRLVRALRHTDPAVRKAAASAARVIGGSRAIRALVEASADAEATVRSSAIAALGDCGDATVVAILVRAFKRGQHEARDSAITALPLLLTRINRKGDLVSFENTARCLHDQAAEVRVSAARALGQAPIPGAADALLPALLDAEAEVRLAASDSLAKLEQPHWADLVKGDEGDFERLGTTGDGRLAAPFVALADSACGTASNGWQFRRAVARGIVSLAATNAAALGESWVRLRALVAKPHSDSHSDGHDDSPAFVASCGSTFGSHDDSRQDRHTDEGIGVELPSSPDHAVRPPGSTDF
jgi:HEAT repeat protein